MGKKKWLRSHVERCLQDVWGVQELALDDDGDYPFRSDTSACWVLLSTAREPWMVSVLAHAAWEVKPTAKLLTELNEIGAAMPAGSVYHRNGAVIVRHTTLASTLDRPSLKFAMEEVTSTADRVGQLVTAVHGGTTPYALDSIDHG